MIKSIVIIKPIVLILAVLVIPLNAAAETGQKITAGDFHETVLLTGSLRALKAERFVVPVTNSWRIQMKWIIKEGEHVEPGDRVVQFDTSSLGNDIENIEMSLQVKEEERLRKLADYNHQEFEAKVKLKQAEIDYKKKKIDASIPKGVESNFKYDTYQLELKKSKQAFENAKIEKTVKLSALKSAIKKLEIEIKEEQAKLEKNKNMFKQLSLSAKTAGTVVYARHPWEGRKLQMGDNVMASWTVATIPDPGSLQVEAWVNETHIQRVRPKQTVDIFLDAYPARSFKGKVTDVSNNAEKRKLWGKAHYFAVSIEPGALDTAIMKPGMSVKCITLVSEHRDVLLVPLEMVGYDSGSFKVKPSGKDPVAITPLGFNRDYLALNKEVALPLGLAENTPLQPVMSGSPGRPQIQLETVK
ncbi:MAG: HlyD family efflux transporter periplasmic adaptor subunit [bacterium]|nr:HlyD family efflux transporter periplasmic adaptor subunit [bacterium]